MRTFRRSASPKSTTASLLLITYRELNADAPGMILFGDDDCVLVKKYDENLKEIAGHAFELTENPGADWRTRVGLPAAS